jgi:hypothetical protein
MDCCVTEREVFYDLSLKINATASTGILGAMVLQDSRDAPGSLF